MNGKTCKLKLYSASIRITNAANETKLQVWRFRTSPSSCGTDPCSGPTPGSCGPPARRRPPSLQFGTWTRRPDHPQHFADAQGGFVAAGVQTATFSACDWCRATRQTPPPDTPPRRRPVLGRWGCKPVPVGSAETELKNQQWRQEQVHSSSSSVKGAWPDAAPLCLRR